MLEQGLLSQKEYFFRLIRHFFSPNFENMPEQAILPKFGFKLFSNGLFLKKKHGTFGRFEPSNIPTPKNFQIFFNSKKLHKILLSHPLEILRPKIKIPGNSPVLITSGNSTLPLSNAWKFLLQFFHYSWGFHILNPPPPCLFFLEQPNEGMP